MEFRHNLWKEFEVQSKGNLVFMEDHVGGICHHAGSSLTLVATVMATRNTMIMERWVMLRGVRLIKGGPVRAKRMRSN